MMSVVFFAGLPRSSTLGIADLFFQSIELKNQRPLMTGHLHLAAAMTDYDLAQFDSPLHLYKAQEALIRCLLNLNGMAFSLDSYLSMLQYYSSSIPGRINSQRLRTAVEDSSFFIVDPSFSHSLYPNILVNLSDILVDLFLVVVWRNPIAFCLDIKQGVFAFDCCLHWILAKPNLSFPLDPLSLWLEFVRPFLHISNRLPPSFGQTFYLHAESIYMHQLSELASKFPCNMAAINRVSGLAGISSLLTDCPFSGDPSYFVQNHSSSSFLVSMGQLARFSTSQSVIDEVASVSKEIGYTLVE